jgi:RNA polymerase sigma factor (TIGR02999 family)
MRTAPDITRLLRTYDEGDPGAMEELARLVYKELQQIARAYMKKERASHTLQPTALVNEAFLRLFQGQTVDWKSSRHFYVVAARVMRRILIDHAKKRGAQRRGKGSQVESFDEAIHLPIPANENLLAVDAALEALATHDPELAQLVELRYFGGMGIEDTAKTLGISSGTVKRNWLKAKAYLLREMKRQGTV